MRYGEAGAEADKSRPDAAARYEIPEDLFPEELPKDKRQGYIIMALNYMREHRPGAGK